MFIEDIRIDDGTIEGEADEHAATLPPSGIVEVPFSSLFFFTDYRGCLPVFVCRIFHPDFFCSEGV